MVWGWLLGRRSERRAEQKEKEEREGSAKVKEEEGEKIDPISVETVH